MKIAIPYDLKERLVPLDNALYIGIFDTDSSKLDEKESLGYGSKEATMQYIIDLGADAVLVKKGFLCPGSYAMSKGKIRYIMVNSKTLKDAIKELPSVEIRDELNFEIYKETE